MRRKNLLSILLVLLLLIAGITVACNRGSKEIEEGAESGAYYCDTPEGEHFLYLNSGNKFTLYALGDNKSGTYSKKDNKLTFTFNYKNDGKADATFDNNAITFVYSDVQLRFLRSVSFVVQFDSNGGTDVASDSVRNGRTLTKPPHPSRSGYTFLGWYEDSALTTYFDFVTQIITEDKTLYARWYKNNTVASEFAVNFDLGYEADTDGFESVRTVGGKLYASQMPVTPKRENHTFKGWFVSMLDDDSQKLSYKWAPDTVFVQNTTLFAVWESDQSTGGKARAPIVSVSATNIVWDDAEGASNYEISIEDSNGMPVLPQVRQGTTSRNFDFSARPAGDYLIKVTSIALSASNNATTVRYFRNKALAKVSLFSVIDPLTLVYNRIPNATNYSITIDCGNSAHNHGTIDNTDQTSYNFSTCMMQTDGIVFRVTASAKGFMSSVGEYVYNKTLDKVDEITVDSTKQIVSWSEVKNATNYIVSVVCGDEGHVHTTDNGAITTYSLKECEPKTGGIQISVYPKTIGYNSPLPTETTFNKKVLASPRRVRLNNSTIEWDAVPTATSYTVKIGNSSYPANTNSLLIDESMNLIPDTHYDVTVTASRGGSDNSLPSDVLVIRNAMSLPETVSYANGVFSWIPVIGVESYNLQVNDGDIIDVPVGSHSYKPELSREGYNTIKIWMAGDKDNYRSIDVYAYSIAFDTMVSTPAKTQYKALGDPVSLPYVEKYAHDLAGWYTTPGNQGFLFEDGSRYSYSHNSVLYASWKIKPSTIALDADGGEISSATTAIYYGEHFTIEEKPRPTLEMGLALFVGWYRTVENIVGGEPVLVDIRMTNENGESLVPSDIFMTDGQPVVFKARWSTQIFSYDLLTDETYRISRYTGEQGYTDDFDLISKLEIPSVHPVDGIAVTTVGALGGSLENPSSNLISVSIPQSILRIERAAFDLCTNLSAIEVSPANVSYSSYNGVLFSDNMTIIEYCPLSKSGAYSIPVGVKGIADSAFFGRTKLTSITIPSTVTVIGISAFEECTSLSNVIFAPNSKLEFIGNLSFANCTSLTGIVIPNTVIEVKQQAFSRSGLVSVTFKGMTSGTAPALTLGQGSFELCRSLLYVNFEKGRNLKTIGDNAFLGLGSSGQNLLEEIEIPNTVESIGQAAFSTNVNLTSVKFETGSRLNSIGDNAFIGCDILEIDIPSSVTIIASGAFQNNVRLTRLTLGQENPQLHTIGSSAFSGCVSLGSVIIPRAVTVIGDFAFSSCETLSSLVFGDNSQLRTIGSSAFSGCVSLGSVIIPRTVTEIGNAAFSKCAAMSSIIFEENSLLQTVGIGSFAHSAIVEIRLPKNVTTLEGGLGNGVFFSCDKLEKVYFEEGTKITNIGEFTFDDCTSLKEINVGVSTEAAYSSLDGILLNKAKTQIIKIPRAKTGMLTIAAEIIELNDAVMATINSFATIEGFVVEEGNAVFFSESGVLFKKDKDAQTVSLIRYPALKTGGYTMPAVVSGMGVSGMSQGAFKNCNLLTELTISGNYKQIPAGAFDGLSGLKKVIIRQGVEKLGDDAFANCSKLEAITIPSSVTAVGNRLFMNCSKLKSLTFHEKIGLRSTIKDIAKGCDNLTIYSAAPINYDNATNPDKRPAFYKCTVSEDGTYVVSYTFATTNLRNGAALNGEGQNLFAAPYREGYTFVGWNTAADGTGDFVPLSNLADHEEIASKAVIYSIWEEA